MTTIKDIASIANVSKSTVSRVVSNNGFVKKETRDKIQKIMSDLNYRPNMFAKGMRTNRSHSIGILFPDFLNPFFSEWYEIVDKLAREKGYLNYICITDPKGETEEKRIEDLMARNIDGIIFFSYCQNLDFWEKLSIISKTTPLICCDSMFEGTDLSYIYADGEKGSYDAVNYLFDNGRKRIAYIKGQLPFAVVEKRFKGYCKALQNHNLEIIPELVFAGNFKKDSGIAAVEKFMRLNNPPDAVVASTDDMAIGAIEWLTKNNINVPGDVAVFGYNNQKITQQSNPPLSTVALPIHEMAEMAVNSLVKLIENKAKHPVQHVFNCELIIREST